MKCPACGSEESEVKDTRRKEYANVRDRRCEKCGTRFRTRETLDPLWLKKRKRTTASIAIPKAVDTHCNTQ